MTSVRFLSLLATALSFFNGASGQIRKQELLHLSRNTCDSLQKFSVTVKTKFRNAIAVDTTVWQEIHYIDRPRDIKVFKQSNGVAFVRAGSDEYQVNNNNTFQRFTNKKFTAYAQEYRHLPFVEPNKFFAAIESELVFTKPTIVESDSIYSLSYSNLRYSSKSIDFNKADFSIRRITEIIYDKMNKDYQFKQILFGQVHVLAATEEDEINDMLTIIRNTSNKISLKSEKEEEKEKPQFIDRSLLEKHLGLLKNGDPDTLANKTVLLDFFYQGCYPCVKSYPYMNDLYKSRRPDVVIIGVDFPLRDSSTIDRYIKKHDLQYPIVVGEQALSLQKFFKEYGAPNFVIIAPDGKVIDRQLGFTEGSFRRFTKSLRNDRAHRRKNFP